MTLHQTRRKTGGKKNYLHGIAFDGAVLFLMGLTIFVPLEPAFAQSATAPAPSPSPTPSPTNTSAAPPKLTEGTPFQVNGLTPPSSTPAPSPASASQPAPATAASTPTPSAAQPVAP